VDAEQQWWVIRGISTEAERVIL